MGIIGGLLLSLIFSVLAQKVVGSFILGGMSLYCFTFMGF